MTGLLGPADIRALAADLGVHLVITPDKSIVRLGSIQAVPQAHLAEAGSAAPRPALH